MLLIVQRERDLPLGSGLGLGLGLGENETPTTPTAAATGASHLINDEEESHKAETTAAPKRQLRRVRTTRTFGRTAAQAP